MPTYDVLGVPVEFPYDAYECQLEYMRSVVRALENGENALLESPTGTGKTLCLLCAALGWRRQRQLAVTEARTSWEKQAEPGAPSLASGTPRIWYSSRTHSQLKQVIQELKKTSYRPWSVVLGSREHFCVHSSVSRHSGARQNAMCKRARDENRCPFFTGLRKGQGSKVNTSLMDIEEIVTACKGSMICPFYKCRDDAKEADLLLIPYDYLINPQTRESLGIGLQNAILVFDEGHNIEKCCESAASFELRAADLGGAITELEDAFDLLESGQCTCDEALGELTPEQLMTQINLLKRNLLTLEDSVHEERLQRDPTCDRIMMRGPGSQILKIFGRGSQRGEGIVAKDAKRICTVVRKAIAALTFSLDTTGSGGLHLDKLQSLLGAMFKPEPEELDKNYQVLIYEDVPDESKRGSKRKAVDFFSDMGSGQAREQKPRTLALWCFSCSVALRQLEKLGVHSLIITSGTLSPLQGTADAFGVPFPVTLENSHVIDTRKQLWAGVLGAGPEGAVLDASFAQRNEPAYLRDLGHVVEKLASCVPDGLLLAFHSYSQKEAVLRTWRQSGVFEEIVKHKPVFEEPRSNFEVQNVMEGYSNCLAQAPPAGGVGGAILAAVCRGKLCEGIDFTDRQCRMVVMVGIPYPSRNDLRVILKQHFLDSRGNDGDGRNWYCREAIRAVNQTLGRVIRHRHDFGGVLLCDARYAREGRLAAIARGLSGWMLPRVSVLSSFEAAISGCREFFGTAPSAGAPAPPPAPPSLAAAATPAAAAAPRAEGEAARSGGRAAAAAPAGKAAKKAVGTPLSALGALWKSKRTPAAEAAGQQGAAPAEERAPATPLAVARQPAAQSKAEAASAPGCPAGPALAKQAPARAAAQPRAAMAPAAPAAHVAAAPAQGEAKRRAKRPAPAPPAVSGAAAAWLGRAAALLPRMELDRIREQLAAMEVDADAVVASGSEAAAKRLEASLQCAAESLLPEFCFDTPVEERLRDALVREWSALMPKLLRPLWRQRVEEVLKARGSARPIW